MFRKAMIARNAPTHLCGLSLWTLTRLISFSYVKHFLLSTHARKNFNVTLILESRTDLRDTKGVGCTIFDPFTLFTGDLKNDPVVPDNIISFSLSFTSLKLLTFLATDHEIIACLISEDTVIEGESKICIFGHFGPYIAIFCTFCPMPDQKPM